MSRIIQHDKNVILTISHSIDWVSWHNIIQHIVSLALKEPIILILIIDTMDIVDIAGESIDFLLNDKIFESVIISGGEDDNDSLLFAAVEFINTETSVNFVYKPYIPV